MVHALWALLCGWGCVSANPPLLSLDAQCALTTPTFTPCDARFASPSFGLSFMTPEFRQMIYDFPLPESITKAPTPSAGIPAGASAPAPATSAPASGPSQAAPTVPTAAPAATATSTVEADEYERAFTPEALGLWRRTVKGKSGWGRGNSKRGRHRTGDCYEFRV